MTKPYRLALLLSALILLSLPGRMISPVWIYKINKDILEFILHNFPLSKSDLSIIMKESGITKDELADIIRNMPDD